MSKKGFIRGGVIGILIGAISGILFAPKSGKETREDIKAAAARANHEAEKRLKQLHTELKHKSDEVRQQADTLKGKAQSELTDLSKRAEIVRGKISETISAVRDFEAEDEEVEKAITEGEELVKEIEHKTSAKSGK